MKRIVALLLVAVLCMGMLSGCGKDEAVKKDGDSKESGKDTSLEYVMDKKELILGLDDSFPPMGFRDDNQEIVGFDIDVAKAVCEKMGIELKLQPISWEAKEQELSAKNIDCIWNGFSKNPDREKNLTLSNCYMKNTQVAVVLADSKIASLADLKGKTVVIQNGSTASDAVEADKAFKDSLGDLVQVEDNVKAMMDLEVGGSDAVVMDEVVARYYTEMNNNKFKVLEDSLAEEEYVIGFRKGENALCDKINEVLSELKKEGKLTEISEKWMGKDIVTIQ